MQSRGDRCHAIVGPCTTTVRGLPTEVELHPGIDPVPRPCFVSLDSVENVSVALLVDRIGRLGEARMSEICAALAVATAVPAEAAEPVVSAR